MGEPSDRTPERDERTGKSAAAMRAQFQQQWVDQQLRIAHERGEFDNLPGRGKPIEGLGESHDPDWWLKKLIERERLSVLPTSLALRKEDAELDGVLDAIHVESEVRRLVTDFNDRVIKARYSLEPGPPLITMPRDVEETVAAWQRRRADRAAQREAQRAAQQQVEREPGRRRRRWRRRP